MVVQSSAYDHSRRRVVVPLVDQDTLNKVTRFPASILNPEFVVQGVPVVLNPLEIVSVPRETLGKKVGSLADEGDLIVMALDELLSRAWK